LPVRAVHAGRQASPVTSILIVDDHALMRSGIRRLLEDAEGYEVVGEASEPREAVRLTRLRRPDVVLLDIGLRGGSGLDIVAELRELGTRVVVVSMRDEPTYARRAFERGANAYVLKDAADEELVGAITAAMEDRPYVHAPLAARLVMRQPEDDLTAREREILRLIALGHTNQEIAGTLYLSVRTVEAHRRHILTKLRLESRADLVRFALEHGLVTREDA
jgi:two-component system, NarL family, response regulator NreC